MGSCAGACVHEPPESVGALLTALHPQRQSEAAAERQQQLFVKLARRLLVRRHVRLAEMLLKHSANPSKNTERPCLSKSFE